jgi:hypothetical protein
LPRTPGAKSWPAKSASENGVLTESCSFSLSSSSSKSPEKAEDEDEHDDEEDGANLIF